MNIMNSNLFNISHTIILCLILLFSLQTIKAEEINFKHVAINERLEELVNGFSSESGIPIVLSEKVLAKEITANANITATSVEEFIEYITKSFNLISYYNGNTIFIHGKDEVQTKLIPIRSEKQFADLVSSLQRLMLWDDNYQLFYDPKLKIMKVSAPESYINVVNEMIHNLSLLKPDPSKIKQEKLKLNPYVMRAFSLENAWADDRRILHKNEYVVIPGVATIIKNMMQDDSESYFQDQQAQISKPSSSQMINAPDRKKRMQLDDSARDQNPSLNLANETNLNPITRSNKFIPKIEADKVTNSVIVYDLNERMPIYDAIIRKLDMASSQIEIEVAIIEVNASKLDQVGINWLFSGKDGEFNITTIASGAPATFSSSRSSETDFSTIFSGEIDTLLAQVQAIASTGDAKIISRPNVITTENIEAVIDSSSSFYVRVNADEDASLFQIKYGTVLKVTPRIRTRNTDQMVTLDVFIEDGNLSEEGSVDDLPMVSSNFINTQASIPENSSLIIGGYYYDKNLVSEFKVPLIGDIPVLGNLFKSKSRISTEFAKLFIISPRIIKEDDFTEAEKKFIKIHNSADNYINTEMFSNHVIFD